MMRSVLPSFCTTRHLVFANKAKAWSFWRVVPPPWVEKFQSTPVEVYCAKVIRLAPQVLHRWWKLSGNSEAKPTAAKWRAPTWVSPIAREVVSQALTTERAPSISSRTEHKHDFGALANWMNAPRPRSITPQKAKPCTNYCCRSLHSLKALENEMR